MKVAIVGVSGARITSYNVCYTKLLRVRIDTPAHEKRIAKIIADRKADQADHEHDQQRLCAPAHEEAR